MPVCSEPTTGLDGAGAYQLIKALRGFVDARHGFVSIVVVLHQPSARVFDLLHNIILMARGSMVFSGPPKEATKFLADCGFVYQGERDAQNRSAAEYILDVLSGEEPGTTGVQGVDNVARLLHRKWKEKFDTELGWDKIDHEMSVFRKRETEILTDLHQEAEEDLQKRNANSFWTRVLQKTGLLNHCRDPAHQAELWCVVFFGTPFPVLPKPGLRKQLHMWFWQIMVRITWRRGFYLHLFVICSLATTVGFVRSFNQSWSRRPHANFVLSIVVSLLGMLGAVLTDEIGPVQRAASSGMILAAHELAQLAHTLITGWLQCHWFAINYFTFLWLRSGVWCCAPFRFDKYYEFTHIIHLHYLVSSGVGSCICAMTGHDLRASFILTIGALMHFHVFALFSPSRNQAERDTKILFGKVDISPLVLFYAKWSYVRYSQEALFLWEPDVENDKVGRNFTLRYFSWQQQNFIADLTWLFALWTLAASTRFIFFAIGNANAYNSAYDIPLFLIFLGKVIVLHWTTLVMMTMVHEFYTSWKQAKLLQDEELQQQKQRELQEAEEVVRRDS